MTEKDALFEYCLRLGDSSLILGHRLSEWCGHGPILEEDIALINIALDFVGRSTSLLKYAAEVEGSNRSEDDLAYARNERQFRNLLITEQPNGDYASTIVRQFLFDAYSFYLYTELTKSKDITISGIAEKSLKEISYHLRHSSQWVLRLGDGTEESHNRTQKALDNLWRFTHEFFEMDEVDALLINSGIAVNLSDLKSNWLNKVSEVFEQATLNIPTNSFMNTGSRQGKHTEHLGYLLAEMQYVNRSYPGCNW